MSSKPHRYYSIRPCRAAWLALAIALFCTAALAAEHAPPDLSTPRATVSAFLDAMNAVEGGRQDRMADAVTCLCLDEVPEGEREVVGYDHVRTLFDIFDSTVVSLDKIPEIPSKGKIEVSVPLVAEAEGHPGFTVVLRRYEDGAWRFSPETLEYAAEFTAQAAENALVESQDPHIDEQVRSPRATMRTFIEGMNRWDEGGREDALKTLDLSQVDVSVREEKGEELAVLLKRILDRHGKVIYQEIHNKPDGPPYIHLQEAEGRIVIGPVIDPETELAEWKFTADTLADLMPLYDAFKDREVVVEEGDQAEPRIVSIAVRDWIGDHFPFLLREDLLIANYQWVGLFLIILAGMAVSRLLAFLLALMVRRWFRRGRMELDAELERGFVKPIRIAFMAWVWLLALSSLGLPPEALKYLRVAAATVSAAGGVWAFYRLVDVLGQYLGEKAARTGNKFDDILVPLVVRSLKVFVATFGVLFVAQMAGHQPTKILAGLGLGGLAFALAAKDTVSNIFGSLTILMDRPFQIGDWIIIDDVEGSVETVGIRSTRVRTFYNSLITVPNSSLINAKVDNMGARRFRRFTTHISLTYGTPPEKIEAFCEGIRELIRRHPYTRKDYYHVWLNQFGPASLDVLLYCFHEAPEWATELRERHRLILDIIRLAERLGVEFAFPTQTLFVRQEGEPDLPPPPATPEDALRKGKGEAARIVSDLLGKHPKPPEPVSFDIPIEADELDGDGHD